MPNSSISRSRRPCRSRMRSRTSIQISSGKKPFESISVSSMAKCSSSPILPFMDFLPLCPPILRNSRRKTKAARRRLLQCWFRFFSSYWPTRPFAATGYWWSQAESNRRPLECHSSALPTELWPLNGKRRSAARGFGPTAEFRNQVSSSSSRPSPMMSVTSSSPSSCLFDEGSLFGLLDLDIVVAFRAAVAPSCPRPRRRRPRAKPSRRRRSPAPPTSASLAGARGGGCCGSGRRSGGGGLAAAAARHGHNDLEHRAALRADDRVLAQIVELGAATAAETLRAELGFCHGSEILETVRMTGKLVLPLAAGKAAVNSVSRPRGRPC